MKVQPMPYPSDAEIEAADVVQLTRWLRFLPSPGLSNILAAAVCGDDDSMAEYLSTLRRERRQIVRIQERLADLGGITAAASKAVGWERPTMSR